jgi:hypothetical protein
LSPFIRYTCAHELLPCIEAALAAHGYTILIPLQPSVSGANTLVMISGETSILLTYPTAGQVGEIEVWGPGQTAATMFLEALPMALQRQPTSPAR